MNFGATSLEELEDARRRAALKRAQRAQAETNRAEAARLRRAERATKHIFGAILRGDGRAVEALVGHGADLGARDAGGRTPLELAQELERSHIVALLTQTEDLSE
jgi:ankyrin repeat protein